MTPRFRNAMETILDERLRQDSKYGGLEHDKLHTDEEWIGLLTARINTLSALVTQQVTLVDQRLVFVEIAALATAWLECKKCL